MIDNVQRLIKAGVKMKDIQRLITVAKKTKINNNE